MSWPDDGLPRFVLASVTGTRINAQAAGGSKGSHEPLPTCYQVLDRAYAHRLIREFSPGGGRTKSSANCRARAELLCARLNHEDADEVAA